MMGLLLERRGSASVARPGEDIDAANAAHVGAQLSASIAPDVDRLVVDLSEVRYVDSAGLDMLFRLNERLRQRRAVLLVAIPPSSPLRRLARLVGLPDAMPVHDSVDAAIEASAPGRAAAADTVVTETAENGA